MPRASPKTRAKAIADLVAGEQPAIVAKRYGLDPAQVRVWKQRYVTAHDSAIPATTPRRPTLERQQQQIGALIIDLLRAKLEASAAIARNASQNKTWLEQQSAAELAAFGEWLDTTAMAIGDRLAGAALPDDAADDAD